MNPPSARTLGRTTLITGCVVGLLAASGMSANGHEPTPFGTKLWTNGATANYKWGVGITPSGDPLNVPTWLQDVLQNVLETTWADPLTNNSNSVRWDGPVSTSADLVARYSSESIQACVDAASGWLGCADGQSSPKRIWIRSNPGSTWCDKLSEPADGCPAAGRVTIHEVAHVSGFLKDVSGSSPTLWETRMNSLNFPYYDTGTWYKRTVGKCDEAALQLKYDVKSTSGPYADCFDHITNHGTYGLVTDLSEAPSSTTTCSGSSVTVSGRLQVHDYGSYGPLGGRGLAARTVWIDRGSTIKYTSATTVPVVGDNWSKTFTVTTGTTVTYNYVAHYDRPVDPDPAEGLDSSPTRGFSITWVEPADC